MTQIKVDATHAIHELGLLTKRTSDARKPLKMIGNYVRELSMQAFADEKDPATHKGWKPLAPETIAARRRGPQKQIRIKILVDTAILRNSVHPSEPTEHSISIGTPVIYGAAHQLGINVPVRRFLGIDREGMIEIQRIMRKYLETGR